jgi:Flp pilus assembly protein TadG
MILTAVALLCVIAAVFSVYMEKKEAEKIADEIADAFSETEITEDQDDKKPSSRSRKGKTEIEPDKTVNDEPANQA